MTKPEESHEQEETSCDRSVGSEAVTRKGAPRRLQLGGIVLLVIVVFVAGRHYLSRLPRRLQDPAEAAAFLGKKELELAEQLLRELPNNEVALVLMGNLHKKRGDSAKALVFLEKALEQNPRLYEVSFTMGQLACTREEYKRGIGFWRKTLRVAPKMYHAHDCIAEALMCLGKYAEAIRELEKSTRITGGSTRSYYLLGQSYLQLRDYDKAKDCYKKVLEIDPDHHEANYGLACVYMRLQQRDEAGKYMAVYKKWQAQIAKRVERGGLDFTSRGELAAYSEGLAAACTQAYKLYRARGNIEKGKEFIKNGKEAFEKALSSAPDQSCLYRELARLHLATGESLKALKLAEEAIALEKSPDNYFMICLCCYENQDKKKALRAIERAMELDPANPEYRQTHNRISGKN